MSRHCLVSLVSSSLPLPLPSLSSSSRRLSLKRSQRRSSPLSKPRTLAYSRRTPVRALVYCRALCVALCALCSAPWPHSGLPCPLPPPPSRPPRPSRAQPRHRSEPRSEARRHSRAADPGKRMAFILSKCFSDLKAFSAQLIFSHVQRPFSARSPSPPPAPLPSPPPPLLPVRPRLVLPFSAWPVSCLHVMEYFIARGFT